MLKPATIAFIVPDSGDGFGLNANVKLPEHDELIVVVAGIVVVADIVVVDVVTELEIFNTASLDILPTHAQYPKLPVPPGLIIEVVPPVVPLTNDEITLPVEHP